MYRQRGGILGVLILLVLGLGLFAHPGIIGSASTNASTSLTQPNTSDPTQLNLKIHLSGAGASFPAPLLFNWTSEYPITGQQNVTLSYSSVGSGKGQAAALNKTTDFGASDAPLSTRQRSMYPGILHIPETIGSVTLSYNLLLTNGTILRTGDMNLTGAVVANIFLGAITNWNDSAIRALNPGLLAVLPNHQILTAHRLDSSGTTFVFTSYLCEESSTWCGHVGNGTSVVWPNGVASQGNSGVAKYVNSTQYSFGYVELQYVVQNNMTYAKILNADGTNYVLPSLQTTSFAVTNYTKTANFPTSAGDWSHVRMLNEPGLNTYPIASFTYLLVYQEMNVVPSMDLNGLAQFNSLVNFLKWAITTGQNFAPGNHYVPLPPVVVAIDQAGINSMKFSTVSTPVTRNISLKIGASGFNNTQPGPSITVVARDTVNLSLNDTDGALHEWYIDLNNNGVLDSNESWITCSSATLGVTHCQPFTPLLLNSRSIPAAGTYTYRDVDTSASGSITILPEQAPAVFGDGGVDLVKVLGMEVLPVIDTTRVATVGSLLIDLRTDIEHGNITIAAANTGTNTLTYSHSFNITGLQLGQVQGVTGLAIRFALNVQVSPYLLSVNILVQLQGSSATTFRTMTRELDMNDHGVVDITDVGVVIAAYGTSIGQTGYNPLADLGGTGSVYIGQLGPLFSNYSYKVFYT